MGSGRLPAKITCKKMSDGFAINASTPVKRSKSKTKYEFGHPAYASKVSFYEIPPTEEVTMEEFELFAVDRLKGNNLEISL